MFAGNRGCPKVIAQHERHSEGVEFFVYSIAIRLLLNHSPSEWFS